MPRIFANLLSYVFHPLVLATYLVVVLFFYAPTLLQPISTDSILAVAVMVFLLTFFIPLLSIAMLKVTKSISSIKLENRQERVMPFIFIAVYYGLTTYLFTYKLRMSDVLIVIFACIAVVILITALISLRYKISAHAAGAWGIAGFLLALNFKLPGNELLIPLTISFVLAGAISSARLALNSHSPGEVSSGAVLGFILSFGAIYIFT